MAKTDWTINEEVTNVKLNDLGTDVNTRAPDNHTHAGTTQLSTTVRHNGTTWVVGNNATPAWAAIRTAGLNVSRQGTAAQVDPVAASAWGVGVDSDRKPGDIVVKS